MSRLGWLDLSAGVAGDMLLGALLGAGVEPDVLAQAVGALGLPVRLHAERVRRGGLAATRVHVDVDATADAGTGRPRRRWADVRALLDRAALHPAVAERAAATFAVLAEAEGAVHGIDPADVHFHEVGALDALADVVGACAGLHALGLDELSAGLVSVGGGTVTSEHGVLPVPGPAVLEISRRHGLPLRGGPVDVELATPTGAALLAVWVERWDALPGMQVDRVGLGAGGRELPGRVNAVRLVLGSGLDDGAPPGAADPPAQNVGVVVEANVDDLDPRLWPSVLASLLRAGAADAWLTPVLMKKGRPAHTVGVLADPTTAAAVREVLFRESTTLGVRETAVNRWVLDRDWLTVEVDGEPVRVKTASLPGGERVNAVPEWEDVVRAAAALGRPAKAVLAAATGLAATAAAPGTAAPDSAPDQPA